MKYGIATNILKTLETSSSVGMFARDTGGCLISRLGLSRSKDESREIAFSELSESAVFYFSAPALAKGTAGLFAKKYGVNKDLFTSDIKNLKNIDSNTLKRIKLGKFGQILSVFSLILPAIFAIAPIRNNVTLSETGKKKFVSVVGLEENDNKKEKQRKTGINKSLNLIKKIAVISAGSLAITGGFLNIMKNKNLYQKAEPFIDKTIKYFDFTKSGDLEMLHYGALIYPVSIASYFWASRDKYEVMENVRRFSVTVPLLFFGEKIIQKPIYKFFDKRYGTNIINKNGIKTYKDIMKLPEAKKIPALKTKNPAYALTFFINTMAIAAGVALLNRIKTKQNYKKQQPESGNEQNLQTTQPTMEKFMLK